MSEPHPRRRRRRHRRNFFAPLLLIVFLLAALLAGYRILFREPEAPAQEVPETVLPADAALPSEEEEAAAQALRSHYERKEGFYTILVSGVDDSNGGSDTNILVAVDSVGQRVYGVSIPRDTKAYFNGKNHKINAAYNSGGMSMLAEVVSQQLGIPVDYTILVDLRGFEALVDTIGGVDFTIPVDMDYDDPVQDLHIHFAKGTAHLSGADALKVVRYRHNNDGTGYGSEDIGRMQTQQNFLKAVAKQTLTASNLTKLDSFVKIFQKYVETDLTLGNLLWLGKTAFAIGPDNIDFATLPGDWKSPYIYLDQEATLSVVNAHLNPYVEDRTAEELQIPD